MSDTNIPEETKPRKSSSNFDKELSDAAQRVGGELEPREREEIIDHVAEEAIEDTFGDATVLVEKDPGAELAPKDGDSTLALFDGRIVVATVRGEPSPEGLYTLVYGGKQKTAPIAVFKPEVQADLQRRKDEQDAAPRSEIDQMGRRPWTPTGDTAELLAARRAPNEAVPEQQADDEPKEGYDYLFDPNRTEEGNTEDAAGRPPQDEGARLAREREHADSIAWNGNIAEDRRRRGS